MVKRLFNFSSELTDNLSLFLLLGEVLLQSGGIQHGSRLRKSLLELKVSLLLNRLSILQPLDELHFKLFHLGDLIHLDVPHVLFLAILLLLLLAGHHHLAPLLLLDQCLQCVCPPRAV